MCLLSNLVGSLPSVWLVLVAGVVALSTVYYYLTLPRGLPPGPVPLPWIGSFPYLLLTGKELPDALSDFGLRYGPIYTLYFGRTAAIVLNDADAIRDVFIKNGAASHGRPDIFFFKYITGGKGFSNIHGPILRNYKRVIATSMRQNGVGDMPPEELVLSEAVSLVEDVKTTDGEAFSPEQYIPHVVTNVLNRLVTSRRFQRTDAKFSERIDALHYLLNPCPSIYLLEVLPWLENLPGNMFNLQTMLPKLNLLNAWIRDLIHEHKQTLDEKKPRDIIDAYLVDFLVQKNGHKEFVYDEAQLNSMLIELFAAGTESTATSLRWGLLYLSLQQEVQERAAREIFDTLGENDRPTYSDRQRMPYVTACLLEIQRISNAVPTIYHSAYEAFNVRGYHVPEGTWIIPNFWFVHRDPAYWPDPERFDPCRHLDADGNVVQPTSFMPYSIGPRTCSGENLAKLELFFFFTLLLQKFRFRLPSGSTPSLKGLIGVAHTPRPFDVIAEPRVWND